MNMTGYQYSATGAFGYAIYQDKEEVCNVSERSDPMKTLVHVRGYGEKWVSEFDPASTLFPGMSRYVCDADQGQTLFRIVYRDLGICDIEFSSEDVSIRAEYGNGAAYAFFSGGTPVAKVTRIHKETVWIPELAGFDVKPYFDIVFEKELGQGVMMAILAFPTLCI